MARQEVIAAALVGIGVACFAGAYLVHHHQTELFVERPPASGDVGVVLVFAQQPSGPVRLQPGRLRLLARPQDLAFQLTARGTGPRNVRIELDVAGKRAVLHEQKVSAPADQEMIDFVLPLKEDLPDELSLVVALEAPHAAAVESVYPLRLTGSAKDPRAPD